MKLIKRIAYPLMILIIAASCSTPRYASAQNDGYYDDDGSYSNNDNSYNNQDYKYNSHNNDYDDPNNYEEAPSEVNINVFTDALTPYGNWVVSASYGRVWAPRYHGFVPYSTGGHWLYSSYGWTWASDYSWGWAPFHYGRWAYDPFYGWIWVPGYEWGPAWVTWRSGGGYYGWTPLGPGMSIGVNIGVGVPYNHWVFAPCRYMGYNNINRYYVRPSHNTTIINNTTIVNNTTVYNNRKFVAGPNRTEVERYSGRSVTPVRIVNSSTPGRTVVNNNTVQMYRPGIKPRVQQNLQNTRDNTNLNQRPNQQNNVQQNSQQRRDQVNRTRDHIQNNTQNNAQQNNQQRQDQVNRPREHIQNNGQNNAPSPDQRDRITNNHQQRIDRQHNAQADNQQRFNQQNNVPAPDQNDRTRNNRPQQHNTDRQADNQRRFNQQNDNGSQLQQMNNENRARSDQFQQRMQQNNQQRMNNERRQQMNDQFNNRQQNSNQQQRQQPVYKQEGNGNKRNGRN